MGRFDFFMGHMAFCHGAFRFAHGAFPNRPWGALCPYRETLVQGNPALPLFRRLETLQSPAALPHNCKKQVLHEIGKVAVMELESDTAILKIGTDKTEIGTAVFEFGTDTLPHRH